MGCILCKFVEKAANPDTDYLCGNCVAQMCTLDKWGVRSTIDKLYLANQTEKAEFLEKVLTGGVRTAQIAQVALKVRTVGIKGLKPRIQ